MFILGAWGRAWSKKISFLGRGARKFYIGDWGGLFSALKFIYSDLRATMKPDLMAAISFLIVDKCSED
jgi:hypothetical protein